MAKNKVKPNLIIVIDGLNSNKVALVEQELNSFTDQIAVELRSKKKHASFVFSSIDFDSNSLEHYKATIHETSFYDVISSVIKKNLSKIKESHTIIHIIHNTDDFIDSENKEFLIKTLPLINKANICFWTNISSNEDKALDFGVVADVYSATSAGIQTMISRMKDKTINFLKGKK